MVGLGSVGSMALWRASALGVSCIGLEQFAVPHDHGAYGGETRLFRLAYLEGSPYVPWLRRASELWRELEAETGERLFDAIGGLYIGSRQAKWLQTIGRVARAHGIAFEELGPREVAERFPPHMLLPGEAAIWDPGAGLLHSVRAVAAATRRAVELGARTVTRCRVLAVEEERSGVRIRTGDGDHFVKTAIVCAGPWTENVLPSVSARLRVRRIAVAWYAADDPSLFRAEVFPVFRRQSAWMERWTAGFSGAPADDDGLVKLGLNGFPEVIGCADLVQRVSKEETRVLSDFVRGLLPGIRPVPVRARAYMDAFSPDGAPLIGAVGGSKRVLVAAGLSGHGFKMAPSFGAALADLALGRPAAIPEVFSPQRLLPRTS